MTAGVRPPRLARWILARACAPRDRAFILSDLDEEMVEMAAEVGSARARWWYRGQVIRSLGPCLSERFRGGQGGADVRVGEASRAAPTEWLAALWSDTRFAVRSLGREPMVVAVTLTSIGLGVGIVTSVFAVANSMLLRPPGAVADPEGVVVVHTSVPGGDRYAETSFLDYEDVAREVDAFSVTAAWRAGGLPLGDGEDNLFVELVTGRYFDLLGVEMAAGRAFLSDETIVGAAESVVVISHALWEARYAGSRGVVGREVRLGDRDFTIVGVAPEELRGRVLEMTVDAWVPIGIPGGTSRSTEREIASRGDRDYNVLARLAPGATVDQAQTQLDNLAASLRREYPDSWQDDAAGDRAFSLLVGAEGRLPPEGRAQLAGIVLFLMVAGGFVLLIACTNVAGLFLARSDRRRREIALRISMGADRRRILRLLLTEALLLATASSGVALLVTYWASTLLRRIPVPLEIPLGFTIHLDPVVAAFALLLACGASLAFGLLPALQASRPDLVSALKDRGGTSTKRQRRFGLRQALVASQVAGSLVLLVGAGLVLRSLDRVSGLELGLEPAGVAVVSVGLVEGDDGLDGRQRLEGLLDRLLAEPPVESVAASALPDGSFLFSGNLRARLDLPGAESAEQNAPTVPFNVVSPGYFELMGIRVLRGRSLDDRDVGGTPTVAVVNEAFARLHWEDGDPLGRTFRTVRTFMFDSDTGAEAASYTVVGVARGISFNPSEPPAPAFWTSMPQAGPMEEVVIHARSRTDAASLVPILRDVMRAENLDGSLFSPQPYQELVDLAFLLSRAASTALTWVGAFTLLLAAAGVFGIVSYSVTRRTPEMAVRKALGARGDQVVLQVVRDAMVMVTIGVVAGLAVVALLAPLARGALYGLAPFDPPALLGGTAVLVCSGLLASWLPARRMASVEPVRALKED